MKRREDTTTLSDGYDQLKEKIANDSAVMASSSSSSRVQGVEMVENLIGQESVSMENFELIRVLGKGG